MKAKAVPTLAVTDMTEARKFYEGLLGFEEIQTTTRDEGAMYRVGDDSYIYVYQRDTPANSTATVCAFAVDNVEETVRALRGKGAKFEEYDIPEMGIKTVNGIAESDGLKTAWLTDPSGNIVAIDDSMSLMARKGRGKRTGGPTTQSPPPS